jgi:hypothetical protein
MFTGLVIMCGGLLAASNLVIARKPNAKQLIDKLTPYQGWIGVALFFSSIWWTFNALRAVGQISQIPVTWTLVMAASVASLVVGFLLSFGLITKYALGKNPTALARGQQIRERLAPKQGGFGVLAMITGALVVLWPYVGIA